MKDNARGYRNETLFKEGFGLDDIEFIKIRPREVDEVVKVFTDAGVTTLPDGRRIQDIVVTRTPPKSKRRFQ